jgi:hypothetical protein
LTRKTKGKATQLEWRRSKVLELKARGMNHGEIAHELQISRASIISDVNYLRSQAKESIKEYVTEQLPQQYEICLYAYEILETSIDNREKLQALDLFERTHLVKLELLSNATTIDSALNYIRNKQEQQQQEPTATGTGTDDNSKQTVF